MGCVIGVLGQIRSGKSTLSAHLRTMYSADVLRNSEILEDILNLLSLPASRENFAALAQSLYGAFGYDLIPKARHRLISDLLENQHQLIVIDGIRYREEVEYYSSFDAFRLIHVDADASTRYLRALAASDKPAEHDLSLEEFLAQSEDPVEKQALALSQFAHFRLHNSGAIAEFTEQIDSVMAALGIAKRSG